MNDSNPQAGPNAVSLNALINAAIDRSAVNRTDRRRDALLYVGNRQTVLPVRVVADTILEPVDKLVWMILALQAGDTGARSVFPTHDDIRKAANIASKSTVARAIAVLRATRWLTLCARKQGDHGGTVCALHDEPLPLADAVQLDAGYMQFLHDAQTHYHARVRAVAKGVLHTLDQASQAGLDVGTPGPPSARGMETTVAGQQEASSRFVDDPAGQKGAVDPNRSSNPVDKSVRNAVHQQSNSEGSGSAETADTRLVYPTRLSDSQRELAQHALNTLSPAQRQPVLDAFEGRIRSERWGMSPATTSSDFSMPAVTP